MELAIVFRLLNLIILQCGIIILPRYYTAAFPGKPQRSPRRVAIVIVYVWIHSALFSVGPLISPSSTHETERSHCVVYWQENYDARWYAASILIGLFILPLLVMTVAYVLIFRKLSDKARKLRSYQDSSYHQGSKQTEDTLNSPAASCWKRTLMTLKRNRSAAQLALEKKLAITVLIVIGMFLLCWLPFFTLNVWTAFEERRIPPAADFITCLLAYANSAFNPLIYGLKNKKFLQTFKAILTCRNPRHTNRPSLARSASVPVLTSTCISRQSVKRHRLDADSPVRVQRKRLTRTKSEGDDTGLSDCDNLTVVSAPGTTSISVRSTPLRRHTTKSKRSKSQRLGSLGKHKITFPSCLTLKNCYAGSNNNLPSAEGQTHRNPAFSQQSPTRRQRHLCNTVSAPTTPVSTATTPLSVATARFFVATSWQTQQHKQRPEVFRFPRKLPTVDPRLRMEQKRPKDASPKTAVLSRILPIIKRGSYNVSTHKTNHADIPAMWREVQPKSPTWLLNQTLVSADLSESIV